ncbi:MAG: hypothetical protein LAE24_09715 [Candidatus Contendobacter sp.]|nr:hypothetical protein [Candidatus Contendobacter sp.]
MTAPATTLTEALKTHLQGITTANGYAVTVASVSVGRSALAGDADGPFPAITLTPLQDTPGDTTLPQSRSQTWTRALVLEATLQETAAWDAELDTLFDAIRTALVRWNSAPLKWSAAEFIPPADGGGLTILRLPLTLTYRLYLKEP